MIKQSVFSRYSLSAVLYLLRCKLFSRFTFSNARIIRLPIDIRGRKQIAVGKKFTTGKYCRLEVINLLNERNVKLVFGENVQINDNVHIAAANSITIGNNVLIASKVFISDHNHGNYGSSLDHPHDHPLSIPHDRPIITKPVVVEDNVWIGEFVAVLPGVTIGKGSIIGALSVVHKSIPPYSIAVGSPAKVIKKFNLTSGVWEKN